MDDSFADRERKIAAFDALERIARDRQVILCRVESDSGGYAVYTCETMTIYASDLATAVLRLKDITQEGD